MTGTVLIVAKAPAGGRSKTRLVPPLTPKEAAALHEALLLDTLEACRRETDDVRILYADPHDEEALAALAPGCHLVRQKGRGLADALRLGIAEHVGRGAVAIVSSDVPGLPSGSLSAAFAALADGADIVLGPAVDGGYWLIAMREAHAAPFVGIPWSTPAVLAVTRQRCVEAGLNVVELPLWRDIDTLVDLAFARQEIAPETAPRTLLLLERIAGGVPEPPPLELVSSELLAGSPWRDLIADRLLWQGRKTTYAYIGAPRAVFVAAVTATDELLLVRQYRHPVRDWTIEVPAGSVVDGESSLEAAKRELHEEAGGESEHWQHLTTFFSSSAHLSLRSDAWLATGVHVGDAAPEEGEAVTLIRMPVGEAFELARQGGFAEGQTALTILLAAAHLESGG